MKNKPTERNWNRFWEEKSTSQFTKISYSKKRILTILDRYVSPGMTVLDAGCGSGFFSNYFIYMKTHVYSVDYSDQALKIAKGITHGKSTAYIKTDLLDHNFGVNYSNKFDLVFTDGLFEHFSIEDQSLLVENFKKILIKEGMIITFVPNKFSLWELIRPIYMPGIHEVPFTIRKLLELFSTTLILEYGGINVLPLPYSPDKKIGQALGMILYCISTQFKK